jgi:hypothetical protein
MTYVSEARVATPHARKYAAQLGKHWAHNLDVLEDGEARRITFPRDARGASWTGDALVTLAPDGDVLVCRIAASESGQRDALKGAVERHVDRFAFREDKLTFDWRDEAQGE